MILAVMRQVTKIEAITTNQNETFKRNYLSSGICFPKLEP